MFPSFIGILDIQSWWEVPSIAHFCSLFRQVFNLLDFDIEDLEGSLLEDSEQDEPGQLLPLIIARLLNGCLHTCDVSTHNYQMYLRRLFRTKSEEQKFHNPFNSDIDFKFLPLRSKVQALHALCDFRLEADDVVDLFKNLDPDSLRVNPLGYDKDGSAYWYFYGTRLYREDLPKCKEFTNKKEKSKSTSECIWQVICFTEQDWINLVLRFERSKHISDILLYKVLVENFLPEIPKLFKQKENQQRKRLLNLQPRRVSVRVNYKQEESIQVSLCNNLDPYTSYICGVENNSYQISSYIESCEYTAMAPTAGHKIKAAKVTGRQTNNSLASATGQILIQNKTSRITPVHAPDTEIFCQTDEDLQTGMYKILECLKSHDDAWPFIDPVEEEYAPNYYSIIRRPMDLQRMEDKLDSGEYGRFSEFRADFQLLVNNCRLYNGQDNEYTEMVDNLQQAFMKATCRFLEQTSSDEELDFPIKPSNNLIRGRPKLKEKITSDENKNAQNNIKSKRINSSSNIPEPVHKRQRSPGESPNRKKKKIISRKEESLIKEIKSPLKAHKKMKKKVIKNETKKNKKNHYEQKESGLNESKDEENDFPKSKSSQKDKSILVDKKNHKNGSTTKIESGEKKKAGRPSKKKKRNKYKKKHSRRSIKINQKVKDAEKKSSSKNMLDSEDGISSRSRSPTPLYSYSDNSGSEMFGIDNQLSNKVKVKSQEKLVAPDDEDKFDKIKNRHKDKSRPLKPKDIFSEKQSTSESDKKRHSGVGERNLKLSDTIEKLRAKNEKIKERAVLFDEIFGKTPPEKEAAERKPTKDEYEFIDESEVTRNKTLDKKSGKKPVNNDTSMDALEAETEQTLKDMNKWFTERHVGNTSHHITKSEKKKNNMADAVSSSKKCEKDLKSVDKTNLKRDIKDNTKRKFLRDSMKQLFNKKRETQRTIDRLQPGKSKGNLINATNTQPITKIALEESIIPSLKSKEIGAQTPESPVSETCSKLSLGSVLPTGGFGLVQQHNFNDDHQKAKASFSTSNETSAIVSDKEDLTQVNEITSLKSPEEDEVFEKPFKVCQEKATPNLSAWFKAFGTPKNQKKKSEEMEDVQQTSVPSVTQFSFKAEQPEKLVPQDKSIEIDSECPDNSINVESPESNPTPRTRRTSTGSTVSDRSNFSQDMDSPRIGIDERMNSSYPLPYPSPINKNIVTQSKISPKSEDVQKSINVGFYQDTATKSSPEKSCSPQEHSPTVQAVTSSATTSHVYPSQNSPNPLQSYPYPNISFEHTQSRTGAKSSIPYYETSKPYDYKAPVLQDNPDYVSLSPNNSTQTFSQPNSPYAQQNNQPSYNNCRHLTNQVAPNSPFSCSNQSSPYSNSDLSSPYGTPQPNSPHSHHATQSSPNQAGPIAYPKKRAHIDEKINLANQSSLSSPNITPNVSICTEKNQMDSTIQKNEINIEKSVLSNSPTAELINMGYSKSDDKMELMSTTDKTIQNIKLHQNTISLGKGNSESENLSNYEMKNKSNEIVMKKDFDKPSGEPIDMFNPANVVFGHSGISSSGFTSTPNPQILSQKCPEVLNMNYENCNADMSRKLINTDDIIHYKHQQLSKSMANQNTSTYQDVFSKNLTRVSDMIDMSDPNTKKLTSALNSSTSKITNASNHHHNEFINYSSRNLNIPGINLNLNQCNSNILIPNSFSNIEDRVPPNAHLGLTLNQTTLLPRNYDIHNANNTNLDLNNRNYKFSTSSPTIIDQSMRKLTNMPQMVEHYTDGECCTPPVSNYYDPKNLQLQPQNAHSVSIASMQMFPQSQTLSMAYNRQSGLNTSNINIQPHTQSAITVPDSPKLTQPEPKKTKSRKKKTTVDNDMMTMTPHQGFQSYAGVKPTTNEPTASIVMKGKNIPGSAFNFGSTQSTLNIPTALYNTSESYLDEYRQNTNPYYLPHRPATQEQEKNRTNQAVSQFQYLSAPTTRSSDYPFIAAPSGALDTTSPLYQQYLQRHQEDLLRQQSNAQMLLNQGLLSNHAAYASPRYHASLGIRQTYDPMNPRPPWL